MTIIIFRTIILYSLVVIALRLMGKREIGQLQPFDFVIILMISELAAIPSEDPSVPLLTGIIPIVILLIASIALSWIETKSIILRRFLNGRPSILIDRGRIVEKEMIRNRFSLTDLLEELRIGNVPNIADVEFAVLETNGKVSILPKSNKRPITPEDMKIQPPYEGLPFILIMDGELIPGNLKNSNKDKKWLENELKKQGINRIEEVYLASLDSSDNLYVQKKEKYMSKQERNAL